MHTSAAAIIILSFSSCRTFPSATASPSPQAGSRQCVPNCSSDAMHSRLLPLPLLKIVLRTRARLRRRDAVPECTPSRLTCFIRSPLCKVNVSLYTRGIFVFMQELCSNDRYLRPLRFSSLLVQTADHTSTSTSRVEVGHSYEYRLPVIECANESSPT